MTSTTVRDRALGAFLGLAVGDALGTTLEFKRRDTYEHLTEMVGGGPFRLAPGQWTDDTSMALCLAESLLARGGFDGGFDERIEGAQRTTRPQQIAKVFKTQAEVSKIALLTILLVS